LNHWKNQKVSETSFLIYKIFRWLRRCFVFAWSFFSSNSRVGERSRETSFLLHRTTKLKHTGSIIVPSFFLVLIQLWEKSSTEAPVFRWFIFGVKVKLCHEENRANNFSDFNFFFRGVLCEIFFRIFKKWSENCGRSSAWKLSNFFQRNLWDRKKWEILGEHCLGVAGIFGKKSKKKLE
jgi:hypothetical protein